MLESMLPYQIVSDKMPVADCKQGRELSLNEDVSAFSHIETSVVCVWFAATGCSRCVTFSSRGSSCPAPRMVGSWCGTWT